MKAIICVSAAWMAAVSTCHAYEEDEIVTFDGELRFPIVLQVIDEDNMLVTVKSLPLIRKANGELKPLSLRADSSIVWIQAPTKGLTDHQPGIYLKKPFRVVGTKQYKTATATSTVPLLKLMSAAEVEEATLTRVWTKGKESITAKFIESKNGRVYLERKDDQTRIDVAMTGLSKEDRN